MKLTILTAYYKTYDLTEKLAKVLTPQLKEGVEWIIIDDGCQEKRLDKFTNVIHLDKNYGGAYAYNRGIESAKGKYIAIIDCDDLVSDDYVDSLLKAIDTNNEDLLFMNWLDMTTKEVHKHPTNIAGWKCIYKKSIMPLFDESILTTWDVPLHYEIMKPKYSKAYIPKTLYYYNSGRPGSITYKLVHKE